MFTQPITIYWRFGANQFGSEFGTDVRLPPGAVTITKKEYLQFSAQVEQSNRDLMLSMGGGKERA